MTPPAPAGYSKRPRLDKLGVKPDARVAIVGLSDAAFRRELATRTADVTTDRPRAASELVFLAVERVAQLGRLARLRGRLQPAGAIWVLWPKGRPSLREDDVRGAAFAAGLVDVKVVAFSDVLSGLKLVIPLAQR